MWGDQDMIGFQQESNNNTGQIRSDHKISKMIYDLCSNSENKRFLEIGTWNGLGSTKFFIHGMLENKDSVFYTLENNSEKCNFARNKWAEFVEKNNLNVHFLNATIISPKELEEYVMDNNLISETDLERKKWLEVDIVNSKNVIESPLSKIDVLLIDGGEFNGHLEFQKLKSISKYVILDDILCEKNSKNHEYMKNSNEYELINEDKLERNGWSVFKNLKF
jgi:hypothetical protein